MSSFQILKGQNNVKKIRMDKDIVGNNVPYLHEGIISEILGYLEVKSLLRCKSVCKLWHAVIQENEFVTMHRLRNRGRYQVIERMGESINSDGTKETFRYLDESVNGLLIEKRISSATKYRIVNPFTKQILDIPKPGNTGYRMSIFIDSSTFSYNLVSVHSPDKECRNIVFKVLGLGCDNPRGFSWRTLNITAFNNIGDYKMYYYRIITLPDGIVYVLKLLNVGFSRPEIIRVDLVRESSTMCVMPESLFHDRNKERVKFEMWQGMPTIHSMEEKKLNVWALKDHKKQKWVEKIVISLPYLKEYPALKEFSPYLTYSRGENMLLYSFSNAGFIYKCKSKVFTGALPTDVTHVRVQETLVYLKGMRPEKEC